MKRGGGLHPARPDWWPPTKRPQATPGGLIAASVTNLPRLEGVPRCLRKSPSFGPCFMTFCGPTALLCVAPHPGEASAASAQMP